MKRLFTSYYNRKGRDPKAVAISCTLPGWLKSEFCGVHRKSDLAPQWWMVDKVNRGEITLEEYNDLYMWLIVEERKLDPQQVIDSLPDGSFLLCYEADRNECHRNLLANWLEAETGISIPEWLPPDQYEAKKRKDEQNKFVDSLLTF